MRYLALATDYDGTLAQEGTVSPGTLAALSRLRASGRQLLLVTGRKLDDLQRVFPEFGVFDRIVAENGALTFNPRTGEERILGEAPSPLFVERLRERGVTPLDVGRVIVATWTPNEQIVLDVIHELGLELQVIFNKGAVMILPTGLNKASGLRSALTELGLSAHNVISVGDAENDHAMLAQAELGVAVSNALPLLKDRADWVTEAARGDGVIELIDALLASDLRELEPRLSRHDIPLGKTRAGEMLAIHPFGRRILLCGSSGAGKSTLATGFMERLHEAGYQSCLVDPEGDFDSLPGSIGVGSERHPPSAEEVVATLEKGEASVTVNLLAIPLDERGRFLDALVARCLELRARTGRPHFLVIDEAHHMLGAEDAAERIATPNTLLLITVHPDRLAPSLLAQIDCLVVVGTKVSDFVEPFYSRIGRVAPDLPSAALEPGEALCVFPHEERKPARFEALPGKVERQRHHRKYAAGELGEDKSFYFRGPDDRLNLRAQNLTLFLQLGDGVDDETWQHHLQGGHYSAWVRTAIKNDELADEMARIEHDERDPAASRRRIREAIEKVYTLPA